MSQSRQTSTTRRPPDISTPAPAVHDTELVDSMSDFLDEVDAILEDNVLETVRLFRQKGGQ